MTKAALLGQWQYFGMVHTITMRLLDTFADGDLDKTPVPAMRSVKELFLHAYAGERLIEDAVRAGKFSQEVESVYHTPEFLAKFKTVAQVKEFCEESRRKSMAFLETLTDEKLAAPLEAWYGTFPLWQFFSFMYDEHWHHRGQLYTYARLLGKTPPKVYDYPNP
jgi:uncharacterized damage-inducible protein DinB